MAFVVALIVGFVALDGPLRWLVIGAGAVIEVGEATFMIRWSRRGRPAVGSETLVGRHAVAASDCAPDGQVRIDGELWAARCEEGCRTGDAVTVTEVVGLVLLVSRQGPRDNRR